MKKIVLLLLICASFNAQSPILDLYNDKDEMNTPVNAYYKDIPNFFNQFVGTWIYVNGLEKLEIRFRKREMMLSRPGEYQYYEDVLVGEYKYINPDGVEKVNSLLNLNVNHLSYFDYNLYSGSQMSNNSVAPFCPECPPGTKRLYIPVVHY
ncbi:DUF6705 family protein [Flavobacterium macrobrachii]|uniref:DUF6705 domain-containing protein n=1 Tax=Flavobacterium macrobrachii TaxID=591204 RepID=A0ABS2CSY4_9FLAO|nr:DUF6705 family protein [Flavobacterium macrobrachii]MBM6498043.1 hypothetical protein [Flavobacterium macrobrachii]